MLDLLKSFELAKESTKEDFMELRGIVIFFGEFKPWLSRNARDGLSNVVQKFKKLARLSSGSPEKSIKPSEKVS